MRQMMQEMGKTPRRKKKGKKGRKGGRVTPKGGQKTKAPSFQLPTREEMEAQLPDALKGPGGALG
jgi:hypothetical protein